MARNTSKNCSGSCAGPRFTIMPSERNMAANEACSSRMILRLSRVIVVSCGESRGSQDGRPGVLMQINSPVEQPRRTRQLACAQIQGSSRPRPGANRAQRLKPGYSGLACRAKTFCTAGISATRRICSATLGKRVTSTPSPSSQRATVNTYKSLLLNCWPRAQGPSK